MKLHRMGTNTHTDTDTSWLCVWLRHNNMVVTSELRWLVVLFWICCPPPPPALFVTWKCSWCVKRSLFTKLWSRVFLSFSKMLHLDKTTDSTAVLMPMLRWRCKFNKLKVKPCVCKICWQSFSQNHLLAKHIRRIHSSQAQSDQSVGTQPEEKKKKRTEPSVGQWHAHEAQDATHTLWFWWQSKQIKRIKVCVFQMDNAL